ncbi:DUF305 domain-containing protein [Sphingomonas sp. TF3]|jgi:uncharacterized protein (DUF305 family)|uniref:DUF305 domain-containing protein n=1 Tax=unclassified Sphingomonas TaxID=196159 RepID=UPI000F861E8A|nr:DUF305 domain-containing protein [Sphingomonas sp. TF3]RUN74952.1 DUF305 domain-containing protein [Sphingomonas sp. TF3]
MKKIIAVMIVGLLATPGIAQMQGMDHSMMDMGQMMKPNPANPYPSAEMEMHQKMTSAMGADATETWVRKMVEHHRGAIAMSRIVLRETKDSKVRMMANKAVAEQTREVGELEGWLKAHGKRAQ